MDKNDRIVILAGLAIAGMAFAVPLVRNTFRTLMILVHEMGQMIAGWAYGYPSLPAFDLAYGGGLTIHIQRSMLLVGVVLGSLIVLGFVYRRTPRAPVFLGVVAAVYAITAFTDWHQVIILFMGHGTELLIGGVFIYRALSGAAVVHSIERPLYAAICFFIVFSDFVFAWSLVTSAFQRAVYQEAKGGGHWMDFSRIAEEYLHTDLSAVALVFFLCCFLPIILGYLAFRYQEYLRAGVRKLAAQENRR